MCIRDSYDTASGLNGAGRVTADVLNIRTAAKSGSTSLGTVSVSYTHLDVYKRQAPYRFVYPGRVYRNETTDARHERAFFQYEALIVDKDFTFASGKVMIKSILSKMCIRDRSLNWR